jgi:hypothetical protein
MKTTMLFRTIANPRRTTLAHLTDADESQTPREEPGPPEHAVILPAQTANPRRTVLMTAPGTAPDAGAPTGSDASPAADTATEEEAAAQ